MNKDKRLLALVSLGLLLTGALVPFIIAAIGRDDLALGFGVIAGLFAWFFAALSWSDFIARRVVIALLLLLPLGGGTLAILYRIRTQNEIAATLEPPAPMDPAAAAGIDRR